MKAGTNELTFWPTALKKPLQKKNKKKFAMLQIEIEEEPTYPPPCTSPEWPPGGLRQQLGNI